HRVPLVDRCPFEPATKTDAYVAHDTVESTERLHGLVDHARASVGIADVGHDDLDAAAFTLDETRGLRGRLPMQICARDHRAFARREHGDRATVADRRVGVVGALRARADDEKPPAGETRGHRLTVTGRAQSVCTSRSVRFPALSSLEK